jgi:hypothetical protein
MGMKVLTIWDDELWQKPHEVVLKTRRFLLDLGHPARQREGGASAGCHILEDRV